MRKSAEPPRWMIALLAVFGLAVDLVTLAWLWHVYDSDTGLTGPQVVAGVTGAVLALVLLVSSAVMSVERTR